MVATYRLQLTPEFGFAEVRGLLPYLKRLGISHLYLSPISEAVPGSQHGYDVIDHNRVREEFGGRSGFEELRQAAVEQGLEIILDIVPNHAGVGPENEAWQDVLAYGPASAFAQNFDIDWQPLKAELREKLLLPFLGSSYGEALDAGELQPGYSDGYFYLHYYDNRFRLSPATYSKLLELQLPLLERQAGYFDLLELTEEYRELGREEREKAEALKARLRQVAQELDWRSALQSLQGRELHAVLERQYWRLAYWKTAGDEINYRRFFDVNSLVALRMEEPAVFWSSHQLLSELVQEEGIAGVRVDHVDGLTDPHSYLESLATLGARRIWVEKILAHGEVLPQEWEVSGTTGYEFMNDSVRLFVQPEGVDALRQAYARFVGEVTSFDDEVVRCKLLVMETSLAGELTRLATMLYRLSETDFHTRDFTLTALREALGQIIASFDRYRTYLPYDREEATEVLSRAVAEAKRLAQNTETSVFDFIFACLVNPLSGALEQTRASLVARFQQYTAPVAAKGIEDTVFYRYVPLAALNEVGGEPDQFTVELQAFHSRARLRQHRYPENLVATATHDHKRGEDTRLRIAALSELHSEWSQLAQRLDERAKRFQREQNPLGAPRVSQKDIYLFFQHLVALWEGEEPERLSLRLQEYMRKVVREAKQESSWISPDAGYEDAVSDFVTAMTLDSEIVRLISPLARQLARYGFLNGLGQLVLKLTTPGVPDFYQGSELLDLSLVDPDNRSAVDYRLRNEYLEGFGSKDRLDREKLLELRAACDTRLKLLISHRLLELRRTHPELFRGSYLPLESARTGTNGGDEHLISYMRASEREQLLVVVPRSLYSIERAGGWGDVVLPLPEELAGDGWREVISMSEHILGDSLQPGRLPFMPAVLFREKPGAGSSGT